MLAGLKGAEDSRHSLNMEEIIDQLITIMYTSFETVSTTAMMALKYLQDHPKALQELREEHLEIRKCKGPNDSIGWNDYKSMTFTHGVILETMRLATVFNGLMRKAIKDIELNGKQELGVSLLLYVIWKGKPVMTYVHGRSWVWQKSPYSVISSRVMTQYSWEEVGDSKLVNFPRVVATNGMYMKISKY